MADEVGQMEEHEALGTERTDRPARKRMSIHRFADAPDLDGDMMPMEGFDPTVMAGFATIAAAGDVRGDVTKCLFREPGENGMSLIYAWFKSGFVLPRHSHDADCLYYVISGELKMGTQTLRMGDSVFIPADFGYTYEVGPDGVEVLEFRNATHFNFLMKQNDEAHFARMAEAVRKGVESWPSEAAPSQRW